MKKRGYSLLWAAIFAITFLSFITKANQDPSLKGAFDVGDTNLYIECYGKGSPTVVVHSGFNGYGSSGGWRKVVAKVQNKVRICLYDRANLGKSDKSTTAYHFGDVAKQLNALLAKAEVKPPFIMVGHSYGSYPVRLYHHLYPEQVHAIMLVDPSQYGQWQNKIDKWQPATETYAEKFQQHFNEELMYWQDPFKNPENLDLKANEKLIAESNDFDDKPYVLIWAQGSNKMSDAPSKYWQGAEPVWFRMKAMFDKAIANMEQLSTHTKVVYANTDKHNVYYHDAETLSEQLLTLATSK